MKTMLAIFITLCLSVALFTTKLYWPLSAAGFGVVFGILPLLFVADSFAIPSTTAFNSG